MQLRRDGLAGAAEALLGMQSLPISSSCSEQIPLIQFLHLHFNMGLTIRGACSFVIIAPGLSLAETLSILQFYTTPAQNYRVASLTNY